MKGIVPKVPFQRTASPRQPEQAVDGKADALIVTEARPELVEATSPPAAPDPVMPRWRCVMPSARMMPGKPLTAFSVGRSQAGR